MLKQLKINIDIEADPLEDVPAASRQAIFDMMYSIYPNSSIEIRSNIVEVTEPKLSRYHVLVSYGDYDSISSTYDKRNISKILDLPDGFTTDDIIKILELTEIPHVLIKSISKL